MDCVPSTTEIHFLTVFEAGSPRSRFQPSGFLVRTLFLIRRWSSCYVLMVFPWYAERLWERDRTLVSLLVRIPIALDQGPAFITPFNLNCLFKALFPNIITLGFMALKQKLQVYTVQSIKISIENFVSCWQLCYVENTLWGTKVNAGLRLLR